MSKEDWDYVSEKALALFAFGQQTAAERGLILVDTKYGGPYHTSFRKHA